MDRTERFYKIQALLKQNKWVTLKQMQTVLEVSRATLFRDLEYLRDRLGLPITWNSDQNGYALVNSQHSDQTNELPGVWFSEREVHALLSMIEIMRQLEPQGLLAHRIDPFRLRLEQLLDENMGHAATVIERIRVMPIACRQVSGETFQAIAHALISRKRLSIDYFSRRHNQATQRDISPQRLVFYRDNWYLEAYCHLRDDLRSFAVDTVSGPKVLTERAVDVDDASLKLMFESSYGIFNGPSKHHAVLRFTPFRARWVAQELWHTAQTYAWLPDGRYELTVPYSEDWELIQDILKQGVDVEVVSPLDLRQKVFELAKTLQKHHESSPERPTTFS